MGNTAWHTKSLEELEIELNTDFSRGLSEEEAAGRIHKYGANELGFKGRTSLWVMLIEQFKDFMIAILIIAALISGFLGEKTDAIIILVIVILNAVIGVFQEIKAENSLEALKDMATPHAKVIRDGEPNIIDARDLVPGDLVGLETGGLVPADLRLVETSNLKIEEAALTGESLPVEKDNKILPGDNIPLGDRNNMAYSGSLVTYGRGNGIVVETGMSTQVGRIAHMIQSQEGAKTPLQRRLASLSKILGMAVLGICGLIFIIGIAYGKDVFDMFLTSVGLAVAAIPEGLPAIITVVLAVGVQRMAKRNAIIRRLPAVETLGSATVICSDKTGTLTQNKMTVKQLYFNNQIKDVADGNQERDSHLNLLITAGVLCNNTQIKESEGELLTIGDPTETALVDFGLSQGLDKRILDGEGTRVYELPFDSKRKLMSTVHDTDKGFRVFAKGGIDELLNICDKVLLDGIFVDLTDAHLTHIKRANETMALGALRVLAMAYKDIDEIPTSDYESTLENSLTLIGLAGMIDPPREEAKHSVKMCRKAGIKPIMITGDHKITATVIARELGILQEEGEIVTGTDIETMNDKELKERVRGISVYARVAPEHKVRIVNAWQEWGHIVAMTGDGVNDAPALRKADIGAAMGITGTDVAKEAADMVITDDDFSTVVAAVEEGRIIFDNITKSIQFLLSCNIGEILLLFVATLLNWKDPLLPIHILWVNLVTDSLPALALGVEPGEKDIMDRKPKDPQRGIFDREMNTQIIFQGTMIGILALIAFIGGRGFDIAVGRTMCFAVLAFSQLFHTFNVRSNTQSIFSLGLLTNTKLVWAVAISMLLQIGVLTLPPISRIFKVRALNFGQWLTVAGLSLLPLLVVEVIKLIKKQF